jgi:hypothetical protein
MRMNKHAGRVQFARSPGCELQTGDRGVWLCVTPEFDEFNARFEQPV